MRIGIDIMGGDLGPLEAIKGCAQAVKELPGTEVVLIGNKETAKPLFDEAGVNADIFHFVHADW